MVLLRVAALAAAAVMAVLALKRVMSEVKLARAAAGAPTRPPPLVKLRQDPRTGVYYPAE